MTAMAPENQNTYDMPDQEPNTMPAGKRFDYLDNIKWVLAVLVILHHSAAIAGVDTFMINFPPVIESERYQYHILSMFQSVNQGFFMSLFFFISAYFVAPSYDKKEAVKFLKGRFIRLGIPLLLTIIFIDPFGFYVSHDISMQTAINQALALYASMLNSYNMLTGVTWFCWTLLIFNIFYVLARKTGLPKKLAKPDQTPLPSITAMILFAMAMIPANYFGLYLMNVLGRDFLGFHLLKYYPMYVVMFYFGIKAQKNNWIEQLTYKHVFIWFVIWVIAKIFLSPFSEMLSRSFEVIGMSTIVLYSFKSLYNFKNRMTKRLSRAAYAAYVIQVIPLSFIAKILLPYITQFPVINFIMVAVPGVTITFVLAHFLCKLPLLNRVF